MLSSSVKKWLICFLAGLLVACGMNGSGAEKAAQEWMQAMFDSDLEAAKSLSKEESLQEDDLRKMKYAFSFAENKASKHGGLQSISTELQELNEEEKTAKVKTTALFNDEETYSHVFHLVYVGGQWKMQ